MRGRRTHVGWTHDAADLLHGVEVRTQAAVHGEDLLVDDGGNGQAVEAVGERLPQLDVVAALALVIEAVYAVDRRALVVATQDEEVLGVLDLVRQKQANRLEGLLAAIHVVAQEEIVRFWREASVFEQAEEIVVLSMDVPTYLGASAGP
jgi:hypothetical protein